VDRVRTGQGDPLKTAAPETLRLRLQVGGEVQGVGFRPFVYRLALDLGLAGWVVNTAGGVVIEVEGGRERLADFETRLQSQPPKNARIEQFQRREIPPVGATGFVIGQSQGGEVTTRIGIDTALCPDCLRELFDPTDRRYLYPLITCTHCGPRYTITRQIPYDRANTSMASFPLCHACAAEYTDPLDRRFHAEPVACPECGPMARLLDETGQPLPGDCFVEAAGLLRQGKIVAVKGLGGFHLLVDALNPEAVARLRARKQREAKPLAVMGLNLPSLRRWLNVDPASQTLLEGVERPIVVVDPAKQEPWMEQVSPGGVGIGALLPYTPIHFLLFHALAGEPSGWDWLERPCEILLVATSANPGGEPLVTGNAEALARLGGIADATLLHDRDIVIRADDSVVLGGRAPVFLRRARGFVPRPVARLEGGSDGVAFGGDLKNTLAFSRGGEIFLSQHIGDLDNGATVAFAEESLTHLLHVLDLHPQWVACDLHPDFRSTRLAEVFAARHGLPLIRVQHHHAHIAAVMAERGLQGPVLGVALDGFGWGEDDQPWGGELLRVDGDGSMRRVGHLRPVALPGGDRAAKEPWRMVVAWLVQALGDGALPELKRRFANRPLLEPLVQRLLAGKETATTTSCGRLFDAAAALILGDVDNRYEGQAPMLLEGAARHGVAGDFPPCDITCGVLDPTPLLLGVLRGQQGGLGVADAAVGFHAGLAKGISQWVLQAAKPENVTDVILGGGCWNNRLLTDAVRMQLELHGLSVTNASIIPGGDGGISAGQVWIAVMKQ